MWPHCVLTINTYMTMDTCITMHCSENSHIIANEFEFWLGLGVNVLLVFSVRVVTVRRKVNGVIKCN